DEGSYEICFSCHQNYPRVTKEAILGYRLGGNYDINGEGAPPYNLPNILTLFRDRNGQGSGKPYDNPLFWTNLYTNLHYFHVQSGGWSYRGATSSSMNCIACHNVHGSNTVSGWAYDEIQYNRHTGTGSDQYGTIDAANYTILSNYPTNCTFNCHSVQGKTHNWFEPPGE
ncbi:MAG: hypothetical protein Q8K68_06730, partial [Nitrospirota bacterium]|nr:hypothetical protein [Nitrospirota bacterium]